MSTPEEVLAGTAKFAVVCGDATAILKSLPDNAAHVCYCDPPYGLSAQDTVVVVPPLHPARSRHHPRRPVRFLGRKVRP